MMTPTPEISEHFSPMSPDQIVLESSVLNSEALWRAFAVARGHRIIDEPAWLAVDSGEDIGGTRVILRGPVTGVLQRAALSHLVEGSSRPVVVEDPFATIDNALDSTGGSADSPWLSMTGASDGSYGEIDGLISDLPATTKGGSY